MKYYGQGGQDSVIKQFFDKKNINNGVFLDVGSLDGLRFSNTWLLEESGWSGICVEAHPSYFNLLKSNRPNSICVSAAAGDDDKENVDISLNFRGSLTTLNFKLEDYFKKDYSEWYGDRDEKSVNNFLNGTHKVKMKKLDTIIEENTIKNQKIDLISIDIDGSEELAFKGLNLLKWKPTLLVLEWSVMGREYMDSFAKTNGYTRSIELDCDVFYVLNSEDNELLRTLKPVGEFINLPHPAEN
jgi:FkbM family methyltransferase